MPRSSIIRTWRSGEGGAFSLPSSCSVFTSELSWSLEQTRGRREKRFTAQREFLLRRETSGQFPLSRIRSLSLCPQVPLLEDPKTG